MKAVNVRKVKEAFLWDCPKCKQVNVLLAWGGEGDACCGCGVCYELKGDPQQGNVQCIGFVGIPSGDHESFVWAVDKETFDRLTLGDKEVKATLKIAPKYYDSPFHKGLFMVYPNLFFQTDKKIRVKMVIEDLGALK